MHTVSTATYAVSSDAWEAMLSDIKIAENSIDFESYIFSADAIGGRFIEAFLERAREGVRVRILLDMVGSFTFYQSGIPEELRQKGIEVIFFNPVSVWRIANLLSNFFRDHRKVLVVDGIVGYTGGVNIADEMADWRDAHVRFQGPVAEELKIAFETMWLHTKKGSYIHRQGRLTTRVPRTFHRDWEVLTNAPRVGERAIYYTLIDHIRQAKKCVYLTTPYFVPDTRLLRVLRLAAKRSVDVRILVPHRVNHLFLTSANNFYFSWLLRAKVKIFRYSGAPLHAKTAVIDDETTLVGTFNLDSLSFVWNYEIAVRSTDPQLVGSMRQHFFENLRMATAINYAEWKRRGVILKLQELLMWPFHGLL